LRSFVELLRSIGDFIKSELETEIRVIVFDLARKTELKQGKDSKQWRKITDLAWRFFWNRSL
jgi:hypothetical protein